MEPNSFLFIRRCGGSNHEPNRLLALLHRWRLFHSLSWRVWLQRPRNVDASISRL